MASVRDMADSARRATGDDILVAGLFAPGDEGGPGGTVGGGIGPALGQGPGAHIVVALSPTRVYLLRQPDGDPAGHLSLAHTFDRRRVAATIHARVHTRTVTLEDTLTGESFVLAGDRSPGAHVTATMHALSDIHDLVG